MLQNTIDEQEATSVESLWKGATNHESLRTTGLDIPKERRGHYTRVGAEFSCAGTIRVGKYFHPQPAYQGPIPRLIALHGLRTQFACK